MQLLSVRDAALLGARERLARIVLEGRHCAPFTDSRRQNSAVTIHHTHDGALGSRFRALRGAILPPRETPACHSKHELHATSRVQRADRLGRCRLAAPLPLYKYAPPHAPCVGELAVGGVQDQARRPCLLAPQGLHLSPPFVEAHGETAVRDPCAGAREESLAPLLRYALCFALRLGDESFVIG